MFWPIQLPFQITCCLFVALILAALCYARWSKRSAGKIIVLTFIVSMLAFIPSCIGVGVIVDQYRFGHFEHSTYAEVNDFRIERYLPTASRDINLFKHLDGNGYRAKYMIDREDLISYIDENWEDWGEYSAISREDLARPNEEFSDGERFEDLGWSIDGVVEIFHSPVESDGGGATYYHHAESGQTLQFAGYW